jgi:hypothetical protein
MKFINETLIFGDFLKKKGRFFFHGAGVKSLPGKRMEEIE